MAKQNPNEEATRLNKTFEQTLETFDELIFASRDFSNEVAKAAKSVFDNNIQVYEQTKSFKKLASITKDFASEINNINDGTKSISALNKHLVKQEEAKSKFAVEYRQTLNKIGIEQSKINEIVEQQKDLYDVLGDDIDSFTDDQLKLIGYFDEQNEILKNQSQTLNQITQRGKTVESAFGGVGKVAEGITVALNKLGLSTLTERLGIDDAITESRRFASTLTEGQEGPASMGEQIGQQFKTLGVLAKNIGTNLITSLGPVPIIIGAVIAAVKFLIGAMFGADEQATNLARSLGLSKDEAYAVRQAFIDNKNNLETQYNTTADIVDAQIQLTELTKFQYQYSQETLDTQIQMTKEMGLGVDEANSLNKLFINNNVQGNKGLGILYKELANYANQNKIKINGNKVLQETSKINGQILSTFRGNTSALISSVIQAEKLGITLEKARDISRGFLDFESSISSELEAELITGKNLNLEKARGLSLQGKFTEAAAAASKEIGDYNYYSNLNVIQQEALAKSINMSADDLSNMLYDQKFLSIEDQKNTQILKEKGLYKKQISSQEIADSMKMLNAQEKFTIQVNRAKEIFSDLVEGGTLDSLADILKGIVKSLSFFNSGSSKQNRDNIRTIKSSDNYEKLDDAKKQEIDKLEEISKNQSSQFSKIMSSMLLAIPGMQPLGYLMTAKNLQKNINSEQATNKISSISSTIDKVPAQDFIIRPGQPIQKFRKDDVVIGGTKLGGDNNQETNNLLKELISIIKVGGNVYLDSTKVGTALSVGTFKTQ